MYFAEQLTQRTGPDSLAAKVKYEKKKKQSLVVYDLREGAYSTTIYVRYVIGWPYKRNQYVTLCDDQFNTLI